MERKELYKLFIPHRCPKCLRSVTLIQPQHRGDAFKGPARGQCLNCMEEQEYKLTIPANRMVGKNYSSRKKPTKTDIAIISPEAR